VTETLSPVFAALGDETRWQILVRLAERPASASRLAPDLPISRQAIVKHLEVLRTVGLVEVEQRGREMVYSPVGARLSRLARELERIGRDWDARLLQIKALAEQPPPPA
jgi:DNA-binding transcriptional ArsR family regulator